MENQEQDGFAIQASQARSAGVEKAMQALGVYVDGERFSRQVVVVGLSRETCETAESSAHAAIGKPVEFWIGGLGPFGGLTEISAEERLAIRFTAPLETAIVEHFTAC